MLLFEKRSNHNSCHLQQIVNSEEGIALLESNFNSSARLGDSYQLQSSEDLTTCKRSENHNIMNFKDRVCTVLVFTFGFISTVAFIVAFLNFLIYKNDRNNILLGSMSHTAYLSIHIDKEVNADILYVIDNFPLPSPPSVATVFPTLSSSNENKIWESFSHSTSTHGAKKEILASGKWMRNVHGNGWHYLSVRSSDFDSFTNNFPKHIIKDVDRDYFAQRYLRTMEALGYLGTV